MEVRIHRMPRPVVLRKQLQHQRAGDKGMEEDEEEAEKDEEEDEDEENEEEEEKLGMVVMV